MLPCGLCGLCVVMQLIARKPMGRRAHSRSETVRAPCALGSFHVTLLQSASRTLPGWNKAKPQLTTTADFIFQP